MTPSVPNPSIGLPSTAGASGRGMRAVDSQIAMVDYAVMCLIELGDQQAMAQIYDTHSRMVYSVALRILKDPAAAEDVLQDVFLKIWKSPSGFLPTGGSLGAWLGTTAKNRAIDALRRRRPTDCVDDVPLQAKDDVAKEVEHRLMTDHAKRLIQALPAKQREAIGMAFIQGLTHAEIARKLEAPLGTVKTNIRTALRQLASSMQSELVT